MEAVSKGDVFPDRERKMAQLNRNPGVIAAGCGLNPIVG